ncbi:hypothetical protein KFK09_002691 [Dendrobium nobile]|uniref:Cyclic nucleotide-binding domain-containing protein n=1 Tax=Dendrobium nobile TaxID=94219 RepID=A0A8T3C7Y6_DENNO|nr:hypothetical protein KFK09_002691 [Dendrobium nobile]
MFDCGYKEQSMDGHKERFIRLEESSPSSYFPSDTRKMNKSSFHVEGFHHGPSNPTKSFRRGIKRGSERLQSIKKTLRFGSTKGIFPEDLKVSEKKIFDPQDEFLLRMNRLFVISCILAVSVDPLFFYLPVYDQDSNCLNIDRNLAYISTTMRTFIDSFYLLRMALQFRTAYIAPSSRVFGRGELVIDPAQIANRYLQRHFIVDFLAVLPLPQIAGAFWYFLAVERQDDCWRLACSNYGGCSKDFLYCSNNHPEGFDQWFNASGQVLNNQCSADGDNPPFDYGIFGQALTAGIVSSRKFVAKFCYCLWFGLQNLRVEEMRIKRRDSEQWMHHRLLPQELRERVRRYDQYKWQETRGVDEENLVQSLPADLRRDIKRHLCLALVRRVPLFANMDERLLDAICERLVPSLYTESTYIVREGDPVDEMLFIIRGRLESVTTDGGRSGFFNRSILKEGDFCGEELLTWALDPKAGANLPSSTRTVKTLTEVEAFALMADELKFVASQFRRLHSRQVQHTFRFYSQQWRTWAACFIQAAWRRYCKRKHAELRRREEEVELIDQSGSSPSLVATIYASKFAANALRGVHKFRNQSGSKLVKLPKPPEPDFSVDEAD